MPLLNPLSMDYPTFVVDPVNRRVGIGTATPNDTFEVADVLHVDTTYNAVFLGHGCGSVNAGSANVGVGYHALQDNTSGVSNVALGNTALANNTTGSNNFGLGTGSLITNTNGSQNIAIGTSALETLNGAAANNNVGIGFQALQAATTASANMGIGGTALSAITTATNNVAVGYGVLQDGNASENTGIGYEALLHGTGGQNVGIGVFAGYTTSGAGNIAIGYDAADTAGVSGDYNIAIGYAAAASLTSGSRNILIGKQANVPSGSTSDYLNIGGALFGNLSSKKRIGVSGGTAVATGDWAASGWGASATISAVTGTDHRGTVTVTTNAADTPTANPTLTLTFKDGTWTTAPFAVTSMDDQGSGPLAAAANHQTATTLVITYIGTPTATSAKTYTFNYWVIA